MTGQNWKEEAEMFDQMIQEKISSIMFDLINDLQNFA